MTTTFGAREEVLTTEYRQKASLLAAFWSNTDADADADADASNPASQLVAQHMLLHHPGYLPVHLLTLKDVRVEVEVEVELELEHREEKNRNSNVPKQASYGLSASASASAIVDSSTDTHVHVQVPSCTHCGGALQPGYMGTTVRLRSVQKTPSRANRRRASRSKAKQILMSNTRKKNRSAADSNLMQFCRARRQQQHQHYQRHQRHQQCGGDETIDRGVPRDCRNYLVIKCGMCQTPCQVPGLPRRNTVGNGTRSIDTPKSTSSPKNTLFTSKNTSHGRAKNNKHAEQVAAKIDDGDFVALEPAVVPKGTYKQTQPPAPTPSTQKRQHPPPPAKQKRKSMTLLDSTKKKKKKTSDQLLSFLSSLNE
jgi:hypothetical protein